MNRRTKIVATIGPSCSKPEMLEQLILAGMNVARLNFSHGTHEDHAKVILQLRILSEKLQRSVTIMQDLQGPKIRIGELADGSVSLVPGEKLTLTTRQVPGDSRLVTVDFPELPHCVTTGGRILLDDGNLELSVTSIGEDWVETRVVIGGLLKPHKGVNLPNACFDIAALSPKDEEDLAFGLEQGVDMIALSFVRTAEDIFNLRSKIERLNPARAETPIIAKLERPEALENLDAIVEASDGVMVARGDLGVEMSPQAVPIAQKRIIECANRQNRLVITATQMLDSMINNPRPTRAEASDVANAIFDGTDAVMLSGETAAGKYPIQAVQTMDAIALQAEEFLPRWGHWKGPDDPESSSDDTLFMTLAARGLAHDRDVSAIAVFTMTGRTALLLSKTRPGVPILAFTPVLDVYRRLAFYWGVEAHQVPHAGSVETMLEDVEAVLASSQLVRPGQQVVLICGYPVGQVCPTNMALLHTVGIGRAG
jgi:pyruvate kinase